MESAKKPVNSFECSICSMSFRRKSNLMRHKNTVHENHHQATLNICGVCGLTFNREDNFNRHVKLEHSFKCFECDKLFNSKVNLFNHLKTHNQSGEGSRLKQTQTTAQCEDEDDLYDFEDAVNSTVKKYTIRGQDITSPSTEYNDVLMFLSHQSEKIKSKLTYEVSKCKGVKWYIAIHVQYSRKSGEEEISTQACFRSKCNILLADTSEFDQQFNVAFQTISKACQNFQREGSDWVVDKIINLELKIGKYVPLAASSYMALPEKLKNTKAIINIKNIDQKCFLWSVLAHLHPQNQHANRVSHYEKYESEINMNGVEYPVKIPKIGLFEKLNNISVNVYGFDEEVYPLRITQVDGEQHVNLLFMSNEKNSHYFLIKDLNRLLASLTKHKCKSYYCHRCLHRFSSEKRLLCHHTLCNKHEPQRIKMPEPGENILKYEEKGFGFKVPFTIYADFECFVRKITTCEPSEEKSSTLMTSQHDPSGFAYVVVDLNGRPIAPPQVYRGKDVVDTFLKSMLAEEEKLTSILEKVTPLVMTPEDKVSFAQATVCHICGGVLDGDKVLDHCHVGGFYRGAAHNMCNLNAKQPKHIPVIFHNLRNYDSHLIMKNVGKIKNKRISVIPNNKEKYVSFSLGNLRFLDSFQFMSTSLDSLVKNLAEEGSEKFTILKQFFDNDSLPLLLRKGVFPYNYVDSEQVLMEGCLPPKNAFKNDLSGDDISDLDYQHALNVWEKFKISNMGEYQDLYVKTDVLLLADVFESFRNLCLKFYRIDPCHTYTAPGLAFVACLRMTGVQLELLTDLDMHLFIEDGIRGGVAMISHRMAEANNKYMSDFNNEKPSKYIIYLDCNNLYGVAMSDFLPLSDFKWMTSGELEAIDFTQVANDSDKGYILEVDLEYPTELHDQHNDYPLAPERLSIFEKNLSPYSKNLLKELNLGQCKIEKLVPNLNGKKNYILHYKNLKQYLSLGLKLTKIHRVIQFKQSQWLKPYIDFNTNERAKAKNSFEKDLFKLLNNAIYGKTMENIRKRVNVELVNNEKKLKKMIASPAFQNFEIFSNDLVAVEAKRACLTLNRPIYAGFAILDLSKTTMFDFHYNYIKNKYNQNSKLLFTDTDSLCYVIQTEDIYQDMKKDDHLFDTSDMPQDHFLFSNTNKKVLGKFKDEMSGKIVKEFVGLRAKMYSLLETDGKNKKVGKGIVKATLRKRISHQNYKDCILEKLLQSEEMNSIRSFKHDVFTVKQRKTTLSPFDDKRYILDDGVTTLAHGHYKIKS